MCGHVINAVKMETDPGGWQSCLRLHKHVKREETDEREENI